MSEEIQNNATTQEPAVSANNETKTEITQTNIETASSDKELINPMTGEVISTGKPKEEKSNSPYKSFIRLEKVVFSA